MLSNLYPGQASPFESQTLMFAYLFDILDVKRHLKISMFKTIASLLIHLKPGWG